MARHRDEIIESPPGENGGSSITGGEGGLAGAESGWQWQWQHVEEAAVAGLEELAVDPESRK